MHGAWHDADSAYGVQLGDAVGRSGRVERFNAPRPPVEQRVFSVRTCSDVLAVKTERRARAVVARPRQRRVPAASEGAPPTEPDNPTAKPNLRAPCRHASEGYEQQQAPVPAHGDISVCTYSILSIPISVHVSMMRGSVGDGARESERKSDCARARERHGVWRERSVY